SSSRRRKPSTPCSGSTCRPASTSKSRSNRRRAMADKRGILGQKIGMTQIWDEQNRAVPVTVIQAGPCRVVQAKTPERAGYSAFSIGQVIQADVFASADIVDVTGISKGKGFTGHIQRHNFKGQGGSHGNHKKHRAPGSIGACATPSRVFKGMKMAGQHGNVRTTTLNLEVVEGDAERGLLLVKGAVPGPAGGLVFARNAVKGATR